MWVGGGRLQLQKIVSYLINIMDKSWHGSMNCISELSTQRFLSSPFTNYLTH
jgi:hypothetical protein